MNVEFLEPARAEFVEAVEHYNARRDGLGFEFSREIQATIQRIIQFPEAWPLISRRTRRCRARRFPYGVIYQHRGETILIVGVMHLRREPQSWKTRIPHPRQ